MFDFRLQAGRAVKRAHLTAPQKQLLRSIRPAAKFLWPNSGQPSEAYGQKSKARKTRKQPAAAPPLVLPHVT